MKKNYRLLPLFIIFVISVSLNIYFYKSDIAKDDTASKMIEDSVMKNENTNNIFTEKPSDYNDFYLLFDELQLTTKNFINIFSQLDHKELTIKKVYPYINPLHEANLRGDLGELTFLGNNNMAEGLNSLIEHYLNALNDYGLDDEMDKVNMYGVYIRVVLVNVSNKTMHDFLTNYPNVKYSMTLDGNYIKIK
jgi:hypothetical protein